MTLRVVRATLLAAVEMIMTFVKIGHTYYNSDQVLKITEDSASACRLWFTDGSNQKIEEPAHVVVSRFNGRTFDLKP